MATIRGRAIQRVKRAQYHAEKIIDQLAPLEETYKEFPDFVEALHAILLFAYQMSEIIEAQAMLEPLGAVIRSEFQHGTDSESSNNDTE